MTLTSTQKISAALIGVAICCSCSRPVAYFQRGALTPSAALKMQPLVTAIPAQAVAPPISIQKLVEAVPVQIEAHLPGNGKLAVTTKLNERMRRVTHLLTPQTLEPTAAHPAQKASFVERLMLRKVNKKINQHLAPANPEKATVANPGRLIGGLVLLLGGILLMILGNGTVGFIGLFVLLFGIVGVILGFFGQQ